MVRRASVSRIAISKITSKGQVTIPDVIRRQVRLQAGDQLEWEVTETGKIEIRRSGMSLDDLVTILPRPKRSLTLEELDRSVQAHLADKHRVRR
jgi:AbrB family looped-hinge helix DNA binding protein